MPGILDRGSVEAGEEATSAGDLVVGLAGLTGHGVEQVAVGRRSELLKARVGTELEHGQGNTGRQRSKPGEEKASQPSQRDSPAGWSGYGVAEGKLAKNRPSGILHRYDAKQDSDHIRCDVT